ncbi:MAG: energy transducer TonB [Ginsengibacter sp.]
MKHIKFKTAALALLALCFAACDNESSENSTALSASDTTQTIANPDSVKSSMTDTSMNKKNVATTTTSGKKKLRASVEKTPEEKNSKYTADKMGIYDHTEVMPSFKGGTDAIEDYINSHIAFPQQALDDSKEGKVNVKFIVNEDGKILDAHTAGPKLGDGLDEEAVRSVSAMPNWTPGTVMGRPVKVRMTLPIMFKTEEQ